jgi:hypothetical protein
MMASKRYTPVTPGGTVCDWLASATEQGAIDNLLRDAAHMPYGTWENFKLRGYEIVESNG